MNVYEYLESKPLTLVDPLGLANEPGAREIYDRVNYHKRRIQEITNEMRDNLKSATKAGIPRSTRDAQVAGDLRKLQKEYASLELWQKKWNVLGERPYRSFLEGTAVLDNVTFKNAVKSALHSWVGSSPAGKVLAAWLKSCDKGTGCYAGTNASLGGTIGLHYALSGETGFQAVAICDTGQICLYFYYGGGPGAGYGASGGGNFGIIKGTNLHRPEQYEGLFLNPNIQVTAGQVGGYGGTAQGVPDIANAPRGYEGGVSVGAGLVVAMTTQVQNYHLLACIDEA